MKEEKEKKLRVEGKGRKEKLEDRKGRRVRGIEEEGASKGMLEKMEERKVTREGREKIENGVNE